METTLIQFVSQLIVDGGLMIVVFCLALGEIVKRWIPDTVLQNKFIPLLNGIVGACIAIFVPQTFSDLSMSMSGIYGAILGFAASGLYEAIPRLFKEKD